eukprot:GHVU01041531.1.p1 GENE.GHVU01041531.1~~GHVU01041531.1.p1  ORF type:complete len:232 (+),score=31.64 GHVU01041531.1:1064-1759(+)
MMIGDPEVGMIDDGMIRETIGDNVRSLALTIGGVMKGDALMDAKDEVLEIFLLRRKKGVIIGGMTNPLERRSLRRRSDRGVMTAHEAIGIGVTTVVTEGATTETIGGTVVMIVGGIEKIAGMIDEIAGMTGVELEAIVAMTNGMVVPIGVVMTAGGGRRRDRLPHVIHEGNVMNCESPGKTIAPPAVIEAVWLPNEDSRWNSFQAWKVMVKLRTRPRQLHPKDPDARTSGR